MRADFSSRTCQRTNLTEPFRPFSIGYDAKLVDVLEIGSNVEPGLGIEVSVWEGRSEGKHIITMSGAGIENFIGRYIHYVSSFTTIHTPCADGGTYTQVFTTKGCLPVSDDYMRGTYYFSTHK